MVALLIFCAFKPQSQSSDDIRDLVQGDVGLEGSTSEAKASRQPDSTFFGTYLMLSVPPRPTAPRCWMFAVRADNFCELMISVYMRRKQGLTATGDQCTRQELSTSSSITLYHYLVESRAAVSTVQGTRHIRYLLAGRCWGPSRPHREFTCPSCLHVSLCLLKTAGDATRFRPP